MSRHAQFYVPTTPGMRLSLATPEHFLHVISSPRADERAKFVLLEQQKREDRAAGVRARLTRVERDSTDYQITIRDSWGLASLALRDTKSIRTSLAEVTDGISWEIERPDKHTTRVNVADGLAKQQINFGETQFTPSAAVVVFAGIGSHIASKHPAVTYRFPFAIQ